MKTIFKSSLTACKSFGFSLPTYDIIDGEIIKVKASRNGETALLTVNYNGKRSKHNFQVEELMALEGSPILVENDVPSWKDDIKLMLFTTNGALSFRSA